MVTAVTVTMSSDIAAKDAVYFHRPRQKRTKDLRQLKRRSATSNAQKSCQSCSPMLLLVPQREASVIT